MRLKRRRLLGAPPSRSMTVPANALNLRYVMAGLVRATHVFDLKRVKTWMRATRSPLRYDEIVLIDSNLMGHRVLP
jgi:hypothetical protein